MPEMQELVLQRPDMMHERFYVKLEGKEHQPWEDILIHGEELEFFYEEEGVWLKGIIGSWDIDDGSGNAPAANAHYFIKVSRDGKTYKYNLHDGLKVRMQAPTREELVARDWCQGGDWEGGWHEPAEWVPCLEHGTRYVAPSGQVVWRCDSHKPEWLTA